MPFIKIARTTEFDNIRVKSYTILGRNVGIIKDPDGTFFATEVSCKHQNADLTTGRFQGDLVTCPRHGWTYNIRTGECLDHDSTPLRRYALEIKGDDIFISTAPIGSAKPAPEEDWDAELRFKAR